MAQCVLRMSKLLFFMPLLLTGPLLLSACGAELGSERCCKALKDKPKGEWTANEAADFTRYCVFYAALTYLLSPSSPSSLLSLLSLLSLFSLL